MDAKITKKRLARLLSYDWIKIIAVAMVAILFWSLIFNMTATKITPSQQFTVFNYHSNGSLSNGFYAEYDKFFAEKTFSYEVIEINVNDLATSGKDNASMLLEARLSTDEGDVLFIANTPDVDTRTEDENGVVSYAATHTQTFFKGWFPYVWNVDTYLLEMQAFVDGYKNADGTFDQTKIKNDFLARVKKNKDKRFKKDEQLQAGIEAEYARIKKYDDALKDFKGYIESGLIKCVEMELVADDGTVYREKGNYAVNLCPDVNTMGGLKKQAYYNSTAEDGSPLPTAKDMCVMFFRLQGVEKTFEYESLLYVNAVIKSAIAETQKQA